MRRLLSLSLTCALGVASLSACTPTPTEPKDANDLLQRVFEAEKRHPYSHRKITATNKLNADDRARTSVQDIDYDVSDPATPRAKGTQEGEGLKGQFIAIGRTSYTSLDGGQTFKKQDMGDAWVKSTARLVKEPRRGTALKKLGTDSVAGKECTKYSLETTEPMAGALELCVDKNFYPWRSVSHFITGPLTMDATVEVTSVDQKVEITEPPAEKVVG